MTRQRRETIHGLGNRKNEIVLRLIHEQGVQPYEGSVRYVKAVRAAGLRRAVVSSSTNCRDVLAAAGIEDLFEEIVDGVVAEREHLQGKPAPDTFLAGANGAGRPAGSARPCSRMRWRASRRAARAASASSWAWTGSGRPTRCAPTAPTSSWTIWPNCSRRHDPASGVLRRALARARDRARPRQARADGVGVRAGQRPYRPARKPR